MTRRFSENEFVHQATAGGEIKLIVAVDSRAEGLPQMDRFTLQSYEGSRISNVGAYELTLATDDEVQAHMKSKEQR